jgi:NDP-sugar pyrophosphorylase family protein
MIPTIIFPEEKCVFKTRQLKTSMARFPLLGMSLLHHALTHFWNQGGEQVIIETNEDPDELKTMLEAETTPDLEIAFQKAPGIETERERKPSTPRMRLPNRGGTNPIVWLDRLINADSIPLFRSFETYLAAVKALAESRSRLRPDISEPFRGVYVGRGTVVSSGAEIRSPCWIGENVQIERGTKISEGSVIGDGCLIDRNALIRDSFVENGTYVGQNLIINNAIVNGQDWIQIKQRSYSIVQDAHLVSPINFYRRTHPALIPVLYS